ncbi:hypothetical protein M406DRAFT_325875 [Cryphonectria parasitica EP155]|uniref:Uncharacterized protein n=1 Tax=Cryphonectria parasitica (strain ATCC 38755 / EP155) TaxID=660469 RepID=A0A9P4YCA5_CRYP1|nr:uncharacterized protein M406DRAFT_325875 [Cryphonectria parasitica EP155]KAF3770425.1 hypothetical protein M406DRAFT_325875 [Cryphonectria parasitica EP155]
MTVSLKVQASLLLHETCGNPRFRAAERGSGPFGSRRLVRMRPERSACLQAWYLIHEGPRNLVKAFFACLHMRANERDLPNGVLPGPADSTADQPSQRAGWI